jgi:hypothetical protein
MDIHGNAAGRKAGKGKAGRLLLLAGAMLCVLAGAAAAVESFREGFERLPPGSEQGWAEGRDGRGWSHASPDAVANDNLFVDRPLAPGNPATGAISFDLKRLPGGDPGSAQSVFTILDTSGRNLMLVQLVWASPQNGGHPVFRLRGDYYNRYGMGLWNDHIPLDNVVEPGRWIHVDMTWNDAEKRYGFYVDGRPVDASPRHWEPNEKKLVPGEIRHRHNENYGKIGDRFRFESRPFGHMLSQAAAIRLGFNRPGGKKVTSRLDGSVMDNFLIVTGEDLEKPAPPGPAVDNLAARYTGKGVLLSWPAPRSHGIDQGFNVYRLKEGDPPEKTELASPTPARDLSFLDQAPKAKGRYRYRVVPVAAGKEWPSAAEASVEVKVSIISSVVDDTFKAAGISGKLVAADRITATLVAEPGGKASFDMGKVTGIPMEEIPANPGGPGIPTVDNGTYRGTYAIRPGDDYENGQILGHFVSSDNVAADNVMSASKWTIDTQPRVVFSIDRTDLPADSTSKARVGLAVKDANGIVLKGRRFKLTLATTDEYTGLVGAGDFNKEVGATVEARWQGQTDAWGTVEFDYRSGFAAKTVILTAKDLESGGVAVDYITSYKEASIDIMLTPPRSLAATRRGLQYIMKIEATRTVLTADGQSRSVIRATVTDPTGKPVAGDNVVFTLSSPNGSIRTIEGVTNATGTATAEYIAGKKIGIVVVTATDILRSVSASISIVLLSDAPAKIILRVRPDSLPADGFSRADIGVKVTDINDNPNDNTKVEFRVAAGTGKLDSLERVTDRSGDAANRFTAGTTPGTVTIAATVRSKVPTSAELAKAQNVLFVPYSDKGEEIRVARWLKRKGETALKGEPIVEYTIGRGDAIYTLNAPYDCRIDFQHVEYWDYAQTGDTLAQITPVVIPGSPNTPPSMVTPSLSPRRR